MASRMDNHLEWQRRVDVRERVSMPRTDLLSNFDEYFGQSRETSIAETNRFRIATIDHPFDHHGIRCFPV